MARCGRGELVHCRCRQSSSAGVPGHPVPGNIERLCIILSCDLCVVVKKFYYPVATHRPAT